MLSPLILRLSGQPPLIIALIIPSKLKVDIPSISILSTISFSDTLPFDSFDSYKDIGLISNFVILPVPVCITLFSLGLADPVNIYCPFNPVLSTSVLIESQITGYICHSSKSLGFSPSKNKDGFVVLILSYCIFLSGS